MVVEQKYQHAIRRSARPGRTLLRYFAEGIIQSRQWERNASQRHDPGAEHNSCGRSLAKHRHVRVVHPRYPFVQRDIDRTFRYRTSPGSIQGAYAFWKFAQVFFQDFPEHRPKDTRISLSGVSYGGKYAPAIFAFFEEQNERIRNGTWTVEGQQKELHLDTLILDSGCIDLPVSWFSYPEMAVNNTYGIVGVNDTILANMTDNLHKPGGCLDQAYQCGNLSERYDPLNIGINKTVNDICFRAGKFCDDWVQGPFSISKRSFYDITVPSALSRTPPFSRAYLQRPHVQEALGMRLNWSSGSPWVAEAFRREGDFARPGWIGKLAYLLERGIKVAFVYGDKDYICNWIGGEAVSLAIDYTDTAKFHAAGYANIVTNDSYIGGQVRQHGNLSFSRVFQTGHGIAGQQPETAEKIVYRALFDLDIATGKEPVTAQNGTIYSSVGVSDSRSVRSEVIGVSVLQVCYILDLNSTCTPDQKEAVANGTAIIRNYMVVDKNSTQRYPEIVGDNWGYGA